MKPTSLLVTLLSVTVLSAQDTSSAIQTGEKLSTALIQKLGGELKAAMGAYGPVGALGFCSTNAIKLTNEISKNPEGNTVKRISLKERNPINRANDEEANILKEWETLLSNGKSIPPYTLKSTDNGHKYYKPLIISNDVCLKCHGNIDGNSELGKAISAAYPNDKATGYKMGDLRGMIVVDIPKPFDR